MKLYLIKRVSDGKFFTVFYGREPRFSDKPGVMFRTPDGVASNLHRLCADPVSVRDRFGFSQTDWINFDGRKLKSYAVVVMDVDIVSMTAVPATDFIQIDAIKTAKKSVMDRRALAA